MPDKKLDKPLNLDNFPNLSIIIIEGIRSFPHNNTGFRSA